MGVIVYYFMGTWIIEERYVRQLRSLKRRMAAVEFLLRIVILIMITVASEKLSDASIELGLAFLAGTFALFLAWDFAVAIGDDDSTQHVRLAWDFWIYDIIGYLLTLTLLVLIHFKCPNSASALILVFVLYLAAAFYRSRHEIFDILTRLKSRNRLR